MISESPPPQHQQNSGNKSIREDSVDIAFVVANSLILLMAFMVGIAANIFVILAVYRQKSLQTSNNALVVNLAVIDSFRCVVDCPVLLSIIVTLYQMEHVNHLICDVQLACFSFSCCIQLLTLASISAERYQAIAQPFKTSQRRTRIKVSIPLTWMLAILAAICCVMFLNDSPVQVKCKGLKGKVKTYDTFGLYMLLPLWVTCFSVIIGFYTRIFTLVKSHNRKIFDKGIFALPKKNNAEDERSKGETAVENGVQKAGVDSGVAQMEPVTQTEAKKDSASALLTANAPQCTTTSLETQKQSENTPEIIELEHPYLPVAQAERKTCGTEKSNPMTVDVKPSNGVAAASVKSSTSTPQRMSNKSDTEKQLKDADIGKTSVEMNQTGLRLHSPPKPNHPEPTSVLLIQPEQTKNSPAGKTLTTAAGDPGSSFPPVSKSSPENEATQQNVEGAVCMMPSKAGKERVNKKKETKMAKRAGYIIITFLLFWLPLITTITANFAYNKNRKSQMSVMQDLEILSVSVSCLTSLSDPIIYAAVNPQFRAEFYRLKNEIKSFFNKK